jgi:hypothetical protein
MSSGVAFAQSCATGADAKSPQQTAELVQSLPDLLKNAGRSGGQVSTVVRDVVASDPSVVPSLVPLLKDADARALRMVGAGLASAANACAGSQPELALRIQQSVVASNIADLVQSFQVSTNDVRTAAIETAVTTSPVPLGPAGTLGNSGSQAFGGGNFRQQSAGRAGGADGPVNLFTNPGGSSGSSVSIVRNTTSTTSVSPSR